MHAEDFGRAIRSFEDLIAEHSEEPEIQERAKVLIHACEKKLHENERTVLRSADDHYNVGIAELNRREIAISNRYRKIRISNTWSLLRKSSERWQKKEDQQA